MSDMVQTRLLDLMAGKVNECFEHNLHRFVMDSEQLKEKQKTHAREKAKVSTHLTMRACTQCLPYTVQDIQYRMPHTV